MLIRIEISLFTIRRSIFEENLTIRITKIKTDII